MSLGIGEISVLEGRKSVVQMHTASGHLREGGVSGANEETRGPWESRWKPPHAKKKTKCSERLIQFFVYRENSSVWNLVTYQASTYPPTVILNPKSLISPLSFHPNSA